MPHPFETMPLDQIITQLLQDGYKLSCEKLIGQNEGSGLKGQTYYSASFSKYTLKWVWNNSFYADDPESAIKGAGIEAGMDRDKRNAPPSEPSQEPLGYPHFGNPCKYCGVKQEDVAIGLCPAR